MHSLRIVQWNFTRRDHPGNPGGVSGLGPFTTQRLKPYFRGEFHADKQIIPLTASDEVQ